MNLKINLKTLNQLSIIYISLPLLIFLLTWLKTYVAIISVVLFAYAIYCGYFKNNTFHLKSLLNSKRVLIIILVISLVWCYFAGIGGLWYQSNDHHWRNAIFRDLISYSWPVYYRSIDVALVYYIGLWLPSAIIIKILSFFLSHFPEFPQHFYFFIGNELMLIYSTLGIFLVFMHLLVALKVRKLSKVLLAVLIFIFFSGMDIVGTLYPIFYDVSFIFNELHLEWWSPFVGQYSSNTSVLFWVYNQGLPAWLLTLMFYNNRKNIENFGTIALLCFFCAPLPFMGLSILIIIFFMKNLFTEYRRNKFYDYVKRTFSIQNFISIVCITPIIFLYLTSNIIASGGNDGVGSGTGPQLVPIFKNWVVVVMYVYFLMLEALIYLMLIYKQYRKTLLYYLMFILLVLCPIITRGMKPDYCMRTTIPIISILALLVIGFLFREYNFKRNKIKYLILCFCLLLGSMTPVFEFARGFDFVIKQRTVFESADFFRGLDNCLEYNGRGKIVNGNFVAEFPKEKIFFKYLARK